MSTVALGVSDYPVKFLNQAGASIPAYGILKLQGGSRINNELIPHGDLSGATGNEALYVNSGLAVANAGYGNCRSVTDSAFWVRYNPGNAPSNGEVVGPVSGQTYVDDTGEGLVVIYKDTAKGLVWCERISSSGTTRVDPPSFTIVEIDPDNGAPIIHMDRGRRRFSPSAADVRDADILYSSDGYLYAAGSGWINKDTGSLIKWNPDTGAVVWYSTKGSLTSPGTVMSTGGIHSGGIGNSAGGGGAAKCQSNLCEASDGVIWLAGGTNGTGWIGAFDPDTGAQTIEINHLSDAVYPADSSGGVVVIDCSGTDGKYIRVYDASGTETASWTAFVPTFCEVIGSIIVVGNGSNLKTLNKGDLTEISTRSVPAGETFLAGTTDGTNVYVSTSHATTPKYRSYLVSNLATENWNGNRDTANNTTAHLKYANSALYDWSTHLRKISASDGSETWELTAGNTAPTTRMSCAVTSDLVYWGNNSSASNVYAVDESSGEVLWTEGIGNNAVGRILPTDDGRLFICGTRTPN